MNRTAIDFLAGLPHRVQTLEDRIRATKKNWIMMTTFLACGSDHELRVIAHDLIHQDQLLDCHAETIVCELPRLVDMAREMIRYRREEDLASAHARLLREEETRYRHIIAQFDGVAESNAKLTAAIADLELKDTK